MVVQVSKAFRRDVFYSNTFVHEGIYSGFIFPLYFVSTVHSLLSDKLLISRFLSYRQLSWGSAVWLRTISSLKFSMEWHLQALFQKEVLPIDPVISLMRYSFYQMNTLFTVKVRLVVKSKKKQYFKLNQKHNYFKVNTK